MTGSLYALSQPPVADRRRKICVIGAGLTGLSASYRLLRHGYEVVVLESNLEAGGMIASFNMGSDRIEYNHHHVSPQDRLLNQLAEELGLGDQISWHPVREALFAGDCLHPLGPLLQYLLFPSVPLIQRLRTVSTLIQCSRPDGWPDLDGQTASDWLRRECGDQAYETLWQPLLRSQFDRDAGEVSAVWMRNSLRSRGPATGKGLGAQKLGYMNGGFGRLINALIQDVTARGGNILYGHTAMNISREQSAGQRTRYRVACILESCVSVEIEADAVIATVSSRQFANITSNLDWPDAYLSQVRSIRYKGGLCMIMRLRRKLSPYYRTVVGDDLPFVLVVEQANLNDASQYGGYVVYLSRYLDVADPLWTQPDGTVFQLFAQGLTRMYPAFTPDDIIDWRLRRTRYAQPVISRDYAARMPALDTPEAGIKLAGMAQVYPGERGMNLAVRLGSDSAAAVVRYFEGQA